MSGCLSVSSHSSIDNRDIIATGTLVSLTFYPRDAMLARVIAIATCPSVRLSVCPSVTRRYCVKTKKASDMISSPSGSPKTLVFPNVCRPNDRTPCGEVNVVVEARRADLQDVLVAAQIRRNGNCQNMNVVARSLGVTIS